MVSCVNHHGAEFTPYGAEVTPYGALLDVDNVARLAGVGVNSPLTVLSSPLMVLSSPLTVLCSMRTWSPVLRV
eukprot:3213380-Pyramimonas_sp.AAC.1